MTKRSKNASRREEMTPFEGRATVTIFSSLEEIEKGRKIYFSLKGKELTIDYLRGCRQTIKFKHIRYLT